MYEALKGGRFLFYPSSVQRMLWDLQRWLIEGLRGLQAESPQILPVSVPIPIRRAGILRIGGGG